MNKIVLGTVQFGLNYGLNNSEGKISELEIEKILKYALKKNIKALDTASAYGDSESVIGLLRQKHEDFKLFEITTKFKYSKTKTLDHHIASSKKNLKIKKLNTVLIHSYYDYINFNLKEKSPEINKIGVSVYTNEEIEKIINDKIIECIQVPFNLLDNEYRRGKILRKVKNKGIEVQVRSVFLQGLFFMNNENIPLNLSNLKPELNILRSLALENNLSMSQMALGYVLSKPYIDKVLIGVDSLDQLKSNIEVSNLILEKNLILNIDSIISKFPFLLNPSNW